jgi:hypothetical protein
MTGARTAVAVLAGAGVCFGAAYAGGLAVDGDGGHHAAAEAPASEPDASAAVVPIARPSLAPAADLPALKVRARRTASPTASSASSASSARTPVAAATPARAVRTSAAVTVRPTTSGSSPTRTSSPTPTARPTPTPTATPAPKQQPAASTPVSAPKTDNKPAAKTVTFFDDGG